MTSLVEGLLKIQTQMKAGVLAAETYSVRGVSVSTGFDKRLKGGVSESASSNKGEVWRDKKSVMEENEEMMLKKGWPSPKVSKGGKKTKRRFNNWKRNLANDWINEVLLIMWLEKT